MTPAFTLAGVFAGLIVIAAPVAQFVVDFAFRLLGLVDSRSFQRRSFNAAAQRRGRASRGSTPV